MHLDDTRCAINSDILTSPTSDVFNAMPLGKKSYKFVVKNPIISDFFARSQPLLLR